MTVAEWAQDARKQGMSERVITELIDVISAGLAEPYQNGAEIGLRITPLGRTELARTEHSR